MPKFQCRTKGDPDSRSVMKKKFQRHKKGVVKRQLEFNRKVGNSTKRIRSPTRSDYGTNTIGG